MFTKDELKTIEYCLDSLVIEQEVKLRFGVPSEVERKWLMNAIPVNQKLLEKVRKM